MKKLAVLALLLLCSALPAGSGYMPDRSMGFIYASGKLDKAGERIHVPRGGTLSASGSPAGGGAFTLAFPDCAYASQECWSNTVSDGRAAKLISSGDFVSVAYDGYCLKYYERRGESLRVLAETSRCWISLEELHRKGFDAIDYGSFIGRIAAKRTFYCIVPLNLRAKPSKESALCATLNRESWRLHLTGKHSGLWAEADAEECDFTDGDSYSPRFVRKLRGWVKMMDDGGYPNIWFYPKG